MPSALKAGCRFKSTVCDTTVMVIKAPPGDHLLACGGVEMGGPSAAVSGEPAADAAGGTLIGKRYVNADESLELLCTKGGAGSLALNGVALEVKQAKQLPSSD